VHCTNALRMGSSNSSFTRKSCTCVRCTSKRVHHLVSGLQVTEFFCDVISSVTSVYLQKKKNKLLHFLNFVDDVVLFHIIRII